MTDVSIFQDRDGNWIGVKPFTWPSGAQGFQREVLIRRSLDCVADAELRAVAELRAEEVFGA